MAETQVNFIDAQTGKAVSDEEARARGYRGLKAREGATIDIVRDDGKVFRVEALDAQIFVEQGFGTKTQAETAHDRRLREAEGAPVQTGLESAASSVTLGISDALARGFNDEYADDMALRREANPIANVVGAVGGSLVGGGLGLAAKGTLGAARGLGAGLVARGAAGAGARAAAAAGKYGASPAVQRIIGIAAEGGIDAVVGGIGAELSEQALSDNLGLSAEHLLAYGKSGAISGLLGLGAGAALGVTGGALGRFVNAERKAKGLSVRGEAPTSPVRQAADEAGVNPGLRSVVADGLDETEVIRAGKAAGMSEEQAIAAARVDVYEDLQKLPKIKEELATKTRNQIDSVVKTRNVDRDMAAGKAKSAIVAQRVNVPPGGEQIVQDAVAEAFESTKKLRREYAERSGRGKFGEETLVKRLDKLEGEVIEAFDKGDARKAYLKIEESKRYLDDLAADSKRASSRSADPEKLEELRLAETFALENGNRFRALLEREDLWGDIGRVQAKRNELMHRYLNYGKEFDKQLVEQTGQADELMDWRFKKSRGSATGAKSFVDKLAEPLHRHEVEDVTSFLEGRAELLKFDLDNGLVPADKVKVFEKALEDTQQTLIDIREQAARLERVGNLKAISDLEAEEAALRGGGVLSGVTDFVTNQAAAVAAGLGSTLVGVPGAAAGAALGNAAARKLRETLGSKATLERLNKLSRLKAQDSVAKSKTRGESIKAMKKWLSGTAPRGAFGGVMQAAPRVFGQDKEKRQANYKRITDEMASYRNNPEKLAAAIGVQIEGLADVAPQTALLFAQKQQQMLAYLESKLPPSMVDTDPLQPHLKKKRFAREADLESFARRFRAANQPQTVLEDLAKGRLTKEAAETVRDLYPEMFKEMQMALVETIAEAKKPLSYKAKIQLGLLLDVTTDPSLTPDFMAEIQKLHADAEEAIANPPAPSNQRPMRLSGGAQTEAQRISANL